MPAASRSLDTQHLPILVRESVWTGDDLAHQQHPTIPTGFELLDASLPGGGWPTRTLTEVLSAQAPLCEWRLLSRCLPSLVKDGGQLLLVAPPQQPHAGGLAQLGVPADQVVWIQAKTPAERLWVTEQLVKSNPRGAVLSWLPQARADQIRRLQVHAQSCQSPVFLFRPVNAQREASPAPLRTLVSLGSGWDIDLRILKRRGTPCPDVLELSAIPGQLNRVLPPRLRRLDTEIVIPTRREEAPDDRYLGRTATPHDQQRVLHRH
ncbi:translesion DNA synthesis-associated protein ImuA [Acidovorax sp. NPDC077693]|uniref:translesion DNA synthesis-associated protein ImuA n=1 Tax=unclassified Acidovorax TaxID=2684926 RepID=UPI0037C8A2BF